ncbi:MAG TPA: hypothetical protein VGQ42_17315 [Candidatus Dormibacteraeota bacterium]|jgi:hypothetical protein|nr:hypothetical protein [Candidatus Dormibacteraeota bacterium]
MMNKRIGLCLPAALVLAACGPIAPVDTDVKHAGANVFYGVPTPSPVPSLPPIIHFLNPVQSFPAPVEQPPVLPQLQALPSPTPDPCPSLPQLSYPAKEATPISPRPPAPGTYPFRHSGKLTTNPGTPSQKVAQLPDSGTRQVTNVSAVGSAQDFSYDVVDSYNSVVTTTSYHLYPQGATGALPAGNGVAPGVYITSVVTADMTFTPLAPGLEIFPFPASPSATWSSVGTDPLGTTVVMGPTASDPKATGSVVNHVRVNACGTPLDAWEATMQGEAQYARGGPNSRVDFTLTIDMATQYGGIIVGDHLVEHYTDQKTGVPADYDAGATINLLPESPSS